ncbi:MAG: hypothetical protein IKH02_06880 [Prevotella sp.]|nr:hypothetical protein [Prevotella sp.]
MDVTIATCGGNTGRKSVLYKALCHNTLFIHLQPSPDKVVHVIVIIVAAARGEGEDSQHYQGMHYFPGREVARP